MPGPVFIRGDTVALRTVEKEDLEFLQARVNDPAIRRPLGGDRPINFEQEREFFEEVVCDDDSVDLLIAQDGEARGMISFNPIRRQAGVAELGYWLDAKYHDQGLTSEAASLLLDHGFEQMGLHRVYAHVFEFNEPSRRLLEGLGFRHEGTLREESVIDGQRADLEVFGLLAREWTESRS